MAVRHGDEFLIALPYGKRTDWLQNVMQKGDAAIVMNGQTFRVNRPELIPMAEATVFFQAKQQRLHHRFGLESALRVHLAS